MTTEIRGVTHLLVTDFHHQRIDEDHRIDRIQRPGSLFGELAGDFLGDPADRVLVRLSPHNPRPECAATSTVAKRTSTSSDRKDLDVNEPTFVPL